MADSKTELVQLKAAFASELEGIQPQATPHTFTRLSQEWYSLDAELAAVSDENAVAVTRVVLHSVKHARTLSGDALDDNLSALHTDLTEIRRMVQLAGDPVIGRRRKRRSTTSST